MSNLTFEIVSRVFDLVGFDKNQVSMIPNLFSNEFLYDKTFEFIDENNKEYNNRICISEANVSDIKIQILIADLSDDLNQEFLCVFRMDDSLFHALKLEKESASINILYDKTWVKSDYLSQAKLLLFFEHIAGLVGKWQKSSNVQEIYNVFVNLTKKDFE